MTGFKSLVEQAGHQDMAEDERQDRENSTVAQDEQYKAQQKEQSGAKQEELAILRSPSGQGGGRKFVAYTVKLPSEQLAALQSIWLELKKLYGAHSPDKSGMIQQAITDWLKRWDGPDRQKLLKELLEIREDTRRRQYRK